MALLALLFNIQYMPELIKCIYWTASNYSETLAEDEIMQVKNCTRVWLYNIKLNNNRLGIIIMFVNSIHFIYMMRSHCIWHYIL